MLFTALLGVLALLAAALLRRPGKRKPMRDDAPSAVQNEPEDRGLFEADGLFEPESEQLEAVAQVVELDRQLQAAKQQLQTRVDTMQRRHASSIRLATTFAELAATRQFVEGAAQPHTHTQREVHVELVREHMCAVLRLLRQSAHYADDGHAIARCALRRPGAELSVTDSANAAAMSDDDLRLFAAHDGDGRVLSRRQLRRMKEALRAAEAQLRQRHSATCNATCSATLDDGTSAHGGKAQGGKAHGDKAHGDKARATHGAAPAACN